MKNWRRSRAYTNNRGPPTVDTRSWVDSVNALHRDGLSWSDPIATTAEVSVDTAPRTPTAIPVQPCAAFSADPFGSLRSWSSGGRDNDEDDNSRAPFGSDQDTAAARGIHRGANDYYNNAQVVPPRRLRSHQHQPPANSLPQYETLPDGMILRTNPGNGQQEHLSVAATLKTFVAVLAAFALLVLVLGALLVLLPMVASSPTHGWQTDPEVTFVAFVVLLGASFVAALPTLHVTELRVAFASENKDRRDRRVSVVTYRMPSCCRSEIEFTARDVVGIGSDDPWISMMVQIPGEDEPTSVLLDDGRRSADSLKKQAALWSNFFGHPSSSTAAEAETTV